ncbi:hypothetical protein AAZX31_08G231400 [Glycine max]
MACLKMSILLPMHSSKSKVSPFMLKVDSNVLELKCSNNNVIITRN